MKLTEQEYELIEAYIDNKLSLSDRKIFEEELKQNGELKTEIELQKEIRLVLKSIAINEKIQKVKTTYQQQRKYAGKTITKQNKTLINWAIAASVAVVVSISFYYFQINNHKKNDEIAFNENFKPDQDIYTSKEFPSASNDATDNNFLEGLNKYKAGKYDETIKKLEALPNDSKTFYYVKYLIGISYLADNKPFKAIENLELALPTTYRTLYQKVEWYLALAYLKNKDFDKAYKLLTKIADNKNTIYQNQAKKILAKMGKN